MWCSMPSTQEISKVDRNNDVRLFKQQQQTMIASVIYRSVQSRHFDATNSFSPTTSPIVHILLAKVILFFLVFVLGDLLPQIFAAMIISIGSGLEFWVTKNMGRLYLHAAWSIDCSGQEDVWIYEANFKSPIKYQQLFWYSQVVYAVGMVIAGIIVAAAGKFSLACACLIAFGANYVNFFAFSKIITLRNQGVLDRIAEDAGARGEMKETIRIPMMHSKKKMGSMVESKYLIKQKSEKSEVYRPSSKESRG